VTAYRHEPLASRGPVLAARRSSFWFLAVLVIVGLLAGSCLQAAGHATAPRAVAAAPVAAAPAVATPAVTHGDLVVTPGETYYIPEKSPPASPTLYYQGGNITVEPGGTLIVQNTTLSFVQFVSDIGNPLERLSHLFKFTIEAGGIALFRNSTITTDAFVVNPYPKIAIVDDGNLTLVNSNVESAGFFNVGTGGDLTLNQSSLAPNPDAANVTLEKRTEPDLRFAPTLSVAGGGEANLFSSVYRDLYGDNGSENGTPYPVPDNATYLDVATGTNASNFSTPTDPASLIEDYLYPAGIAGGNVTLNYVDKNLANTTVVITVWYGGVAYPLPTPVKLIESTSASVETPFSAALVSAINAGGMMGWLNHTGSFNTSRQISVAFDVTTGPAVPNTNASLELQSPLDFGLNASGAGTVLNTVNTYIGLNFAPAGTPAWYTHNLTLKDGATAYLANLTVQGIFQNLTSQASYGAVVPFGTSNAYLFRWADVHLDGKGGLLAVPNATLTAPYAYGSTQADNATAQKVNDFQTNDPAIWDYLQYYDTLRGFAGYGLSNVAGVASLLLASNDIYGASGPDGDFLGNYHVILTPPANSGTAKAYNWSVRPYPAGVSNGSDGYGVPDNWGFVQFPLYFAGATVPTGGVVVTADSVATDTILIGDLMNVTVTVDDAGPAPITNLTGTLYYNATDNVVLQSVFKPVTLTAPGQTSSVEMSWTVNDTVVGLHGKGVADSLYIQIVWNKDIASRGGGFLTTNASVTFDPSHVALSGLTLPPSASLAGDGSYVTSGIVTYNGSQDALVKVLAIPGSGPVVVLGQSLVTPAAKEGGPSSFIIAWKAAVLTPGKGYTIYVVASYNGVVANKSLGSYSVPGPSAASFLFHKFLGLDLWLWIVIAAAIAAGIVGFLWFSRRQAAGKLVECGECGNLVPEDSKVCPKCGAEFESDVVRCSRCSSTIPANSQYCPECAAQLLGKPGEGGPDPERQAYADFTERFRAEAKKELGENYSEGAFWDWWKRQSTYTPFSQWKLQQGAGTPRAGATAPPPQSRPPSGGAGAPPPRRRPAAAPPARPPPPSGAPAAAAAPAAAPPPAPTPAPAAGAMKPCPNCGKEIPPEYLVCPFCGSVTQ